MLSAPSLSLTSNHSVIYVFIYRMSQLHDCQDEPHKYSYAVMNHIQLFALISESTHLYYLPVKQALLHVFVCVCVNVCVGGC